MDNQVDIDPYKGLIDNQNYMKYQDFKSGFRRASKFSGSPLVVVFSIIVAVFAGVVVIDNVTGLVEISPNQSFAQSANPILDMTKTVTRCAKYAPSSGRYWVLPGIRNNADKCLKNTVPQRNAVLSLVAERKPHELLAKGILLSKSAIANLPKTLLAFVEQPVSLNGFVYQANLLQQAINAVNVLQNPDYYITTPCTPIDCVFPIYTPEKLNNFVGQEGQVQGIEYDGKIYVTDPFKDIQFIGPPVQQSVSSPRLTVIAINAAGTTPQLSIASLTSFVNGVKAFYSQTSYGLLNLNTRVIGWQAVSPDGLDCASPDSGFAWCERARNALGLPDHNTTDNFYAYVIAPVDSTKCTYRGFDNANTAFWLIQNANSTTFDTQQSVFVHETGHLVGKNPQTGDTRGFFHEGRSSCPVSQGFCNYQEYAEDADGDPMGRKNTAGTATDFSSIHKLAAGWLT